ncbi:hypothetical protein M0813_20241 [Anaeramoeba flamelloides]|uniref:Uncharacterized protein n=1 Tax=Anaeramoeba flamelloides TaxID=1746091 RepID=A0ABQ8YMJ3_9EUKA|nr:hypothetical protein M0813_20241 [Anaeramoeba flamelloides]
MFGLFVAFYEAFIKRDWGCQAAAAPALNHPILLITLMIKISSWSTPIFPAYDEILIINVTKRIAVLGRAGENSEIQFTFGK